MERVRAAPEFTAGPPARRRGSFYPVGRLAWIAAIGLAMWQGGPGTRSLHAAERGTAITTEDVRIAGPTPDSVIGLRIYRPATSGPYPLVVINHGSTANAQDRTRIDTARYAAVARWFARRNYVVVLPLRPGHGPDGGPYLEQYGPCDRPDYVAAGLGGASSIAAAVRYAQTRHDVAREPPILVGHSAGAWAAMALGSIKGERVKAVINFAGGLGGRSYGFANRNCAPDRLIAAAAEWGRAAKYPSLWLYADNDGYFAPDLVKRLAAAYASSGARVDLRMLPAFGDDGHFLLFDPASMPIWTPILEKFLDTIAAGSAGRQTGSASGRK